MKKQKHSAATCGVFAALTAVFSMLSFPTPSGVPLTLQTLAVALYGFIFPPAQAMKITAVYLSCGALGLPVFGLMKGGFWVLLGPTGGFLWGFLFYALFCSLPLKRSPLRLASGAVGLLFCHLLGLAQYCFLGEIPPVTGFLTLTLPLLLKDLVLLVAAFVLAKPCKKALRSIEGQSILKEEESL